MPGSDPHGVPLRGDDGHALPGHLVDEALVAYVGRGTSSRPTRRPEAVERLAPDGRAAELLALVERLHAEADEVDLAPDEAVDHSLVPAFAAVVRARHPWLGDTAVDALCWASRYRRMYE